MISLRKFLALFAAVVVAMVSGVAVAQADSPPAVGATPNVYTMPGGHISGGRLWNTTCEKYATTVVRCRAQIWATQVQYRGGQYVSTTGWTFNNLTYLPGTRAQWAGNNLARNNSSWNSADRTWRTECDTASTGFGGCRSYVWGKQVHLENGQYVIKSDWVFNNIVLFASTPADRVTQVPDWVIDQSRLDVNGLVPSPIRLGASMKDLAKLGYFKYEGDWFPYSSPSLSNRGVSTSSRGDTLEDVQLAVKGLKTVDGARVGMTLGEIKAIYGDRLRLEFKKSWWDVSTAVVQRDGNELVFWTDYGSEEAKPMVDSDVIHFIRARAISPELF